MALIRFTISMSGVLAIALPALLAQAEVPAPPAGGASVSAASDDGVWYAGARSGGIRVDRDDFQYGQIAMDSNDDTAAVVLASIQSVSHDLDEWGGGGKFFGGKHFSDTFAIEARFGFGLFDTTSNAVIFPTSDDGGLNFLIPYLDAGMSPAPNRSLRAGIFGVRFRDRSPPVMVRLGSKYKIFDWGLDFVTTHVETDTVEFQSVIGPAFAHLNQEYDYMVSGDAIGGWSRPTSIRTREEIDEFYAGVKLGGRGSIGLTDALTFVGSANISLFYHHADLDARQNINAGNTLISLDDKSEDFSHKVELLTGLEYRLTDRVRIGTFYEFNAWYNAANVDNPSLALVNFSGDNRWVGAAPAQLGDETVMTHSILLSVTVAF